MLLHYEKANQVQVEVQIGKMIVQKYIDRRKDSGKVSALPDTKMVVSMSLTGHDMDYLYGALRYSQLVPIIFPNWRVRVYVDKFEATTNLNQNQIIQVLQFVGEEAAVCGCGGHYAGEECNICAATCNVAISHRR